MIVRENIRSTESNSPPPITPPTGKKNAIEFKGSENLILGIKLGQRGDKPLDPLKKDGFTSTKDSVGTFQSYIKDEEEVTYNFADNNKKNTVSLGISRYSEKPTTTNIKLGTEDALNISSLHEVGGLTANEGGTVTLKLLEETQTHGNKKQVIHTTYVTFPESELDAITASLSSKQKEALKKLKSEMETTATENFLEETYDGVVNGDNEEEYGYYPVESEEPNGSPTKEPTIISSTASSTV